MSQLATLIHCTYQHLFDIRPSAFLEQDVVDMAIKMKERLHAKVMDDTTFNMIEIRELFEAINHTKTITGVATLLRSLVQPLDSLGLIHAKQESVRELEENVELSYRLNEYVNSLVEKEWEVYRYFFDERCLNKYSQYDVYRATSVFFKRLMDGVKDVPKSKTSYLETLLEDIKSIDGTHGIELIKGPVYSTFGGFKAGSEVGLFTPRVKFTLRSMKPTLIAPFVAAFLAPLSVSSCNVNMWLTTMNILPLGAFGYLIASMLPQEFDYNHFTLPLRDIYVVDENIRKGIDAIGKIDELLSFLKYSKAMNGEVTMPVVTEASPHYFVAKGAKNPILLSNSDCIPNDVNLNGQKLTFITGPNSGGKSTFCKMIAQMQVLAQIGCYVPAEEAEMSIADRIFYQEPESGSLENAEGGLDAQLIRTQYIFFHSTPKSLVVLDDILRGATTYEEALEESHDILDGFNTIGNNTILITHAHELVEQFRQEGKGQYLQAEFKEGTQTYKLVPGISKKSHADLVSQKIGFSKEDIRTHLEERGYLE